MYAVNAMFTKMTRQTKKKQHKPRPAQKCSRHFHTSQRIWKEEGWDLLHNNQFITNLLMSCLKTTLRNRVYYYKHKFHNAFSKNCQYAKRHLY